MSKMGLGLLRKHSISVTAQAVGRMDLRLRGEDAMSNVAKSCFWLVSNLPRGLAKSLFDIVFDDIFELGCDVGAAQRHRLCPVDENRCRRLFAGAGQ